MGSMMQKMTKEREAHIITKAVETYADEDQEDVLIEEMSELTKAIIKLRRAVANREGDNILEIREDAIREEMADVQIMLYQMTMIHGDFNDWKIRKLNRLARKLGLE